MTDAVSVPRAGVQHAGQPPRPRRELPTAVLRYLYRHRPARKLLGIMLIHLIYAVKRIRVRDELIVSPQVPLDAYSLWKLCRLSGIRMVSERQARTASRSDLLGRMQHDDLTWGDPAPGSLNGLCTDISKSHVDAMFAEAFGYGTKLDPTVFQGRAVIKPEANYAGGGTFVTCPIPISQVRPDHIYQRLVDNETAPGIVTEYRVAVICGEIADVIVQRRAIENRLTGRGRGGGLGSTIRPAEEVFSEAEIAGILRFCELIHMDFGELDVLPDVNERRIYVLDANKTPSCMVRATAFTAERFRLVHRRAGIFRRLLRERALDTRSANAAEPFRASAAD